jgi:hypothetical protein
MSYPGWMFKLVRAADLYNFIYEQSATYIKDQLKHDATPQRIGNDEWDILTWLEVEDPDPTFGVWAGELIHDVRSALDQLVYALVSENDNDAGEHTQFPIYDSETNWIRDIEERDPTRNPSPIRGVTDDEFAFIKAAQPYHLAHKKRAGHPLMQLLRMSNVDKHRTLHAAAIRTSAPTRVFYQPEGYVMILKKTLTKPGTLVKAGAEIGRVKRRLIAVPPPGTQVQLRIQGVTELVFMQEGKPPIAGVNDLGLIIQAARDIVKGLRPWEPPVPLPEGW